MTANSIKPLALYLFGSYPIGLAILLIITILAPGMVGQAMLEAPPGVEFVLGAGVIFAWRNH